MLIVIYAIVILQSLILLALLALIVRRIFLRFWIKYIEARKNYFTPMVLGLLDEPNNITSLSQKLRPFDRGLIEVLMLQQATEIKGQERTIMTTAFEKLGYVDSEKKNLESRWWWRRHDAAIKLGIMLSEEAVPTLIKAVNDPSEEVRLAAVRALGQTRYPQSITALFQVMEEREDWTADRVLEILVGLGDTHKEPVLSRLTLPMNPRVKVLLVQLCGLMKWSEAVPVLLPLLNDTDAEMRMSAARSVGSIGDATTAEHLTPILQDEQWEVRAQVAESLGLLQNDIAVEPLANFLSDDNWWVRYNAAKSLYQLGQDGISELQELRSSESKVVSGIAAQALAEGELGL